MSVSDFLGVNSIELHIENIFENIFDILVLENLTEKYFLVLKSEKDFQTDFQ